MLFASGGCYEAGRLCSNRGSQLLARLKGIEAETGKDLAGMIIAFIAANAKVGKTRTKGAG